LKKGGQGGFHKRLKIPLDPPFPKGDFDGHISLANDIDDLLINKCYLYIIRMTRMSQQDLYFATGVFTMIGIIGSGLDSLIVTRAVREKIPGMDVLCFGDNLRIFPAAAFNPDEMIQHAVQNTAFLVGLGARLILIASHTLSCIAGAANSASSAGVPVLDIITPSVSRAVLKSRHGRIGIIGSRAVIESRLYPEKIREHRPEAGIYSASCPLLVPLIEEGWLKKPVTAMIIKKYLIPLKTRQVDTLILASTPYSFLSTVIQRKIGKQVRVIDGAEALSETAAAYLDAHPDVAAQMQQTDRLQVMLSWPSTFLEKQAKDILNTRDIETARP
jgi:glutamate racemase